MTKNYLDLNRSKNNQYMRDVFIDGIFEEAQKNKDIYFTTPDMGAPSLDQFREKIPKQYIHSGICEQHMISMAAGLTMMNKKVFCYAMAPFITSRCYEQIKCSIAAMQQPVNLVGIGVGLGYADAGPTHYTTEDIATMRVFPDIEIITAADEVFTKKLVNYCLNKDKFRFIRLDRDALPIIYQDSNKIDLELGFSEIHTKKSDCCIISCGFLLHKVSELINRKNLNYSLIDLFKIKPINKEFLEHIKKYKTIITIEEQWLDGGFGSAILEKISDAELDIKVKRYGLERKYLFENGGRNFLLNKFGLNLEKIL